MPSEEDCAGDGGAVGRRMSARTGNVGKLRPTTVSLPSCMFSFVRDVLQMPVNFFSGSAASLALFELRAAQGAALTRRCVQSIDSVHEIPSQPLEDGPRIIVMMPRRSCCKFVR